MSDKPTDKNNLEGFGADFNSVAGLYKIPGFQEVKLTDRLDYIFSHRPAVLDEVREMLQKAGLDYIVLVSYPYPKDPSKPVINVEWSTENSLSRGESQAEVIVPVLSFFLDRLSDMFGDEIVDALPTREKEED